MARPALLRFEPQSLSAARESRGCSGVVPRRRDGPRGLVPQPRDSTGSRTRPDYSRPAHPQRTGGTTRPSRPGPPAPPGMPPLPARPVRTEWDGSPERGAPVRLTAAAKDLQHWPQVDRHRLVGDLRMIFGSADRLATDAALVGLYSMPDSPWRAAWPSNRLVASRALAAALAPLGIAPIKLRIGAQVLRGYLRRHFEPVWSEMDSAGPV